MHYLKQSLDFFVFNFLEIIAFQFYKADNLVQLVSVMVLYYFKQFYSLHSVLLFVCNHLWLFIAYST